MMFGPLYPGDGAWIAGIVAGALVIILTLFWAFGGFDDVREARGPKPTVVRICKDGSHLFRYPDGTVKTAWGYVVEGDLAAICE
jgi:hypothetical protein